MAKSGGSPSSNSVLLRNTRRRPYSGGSNSGACSSPTASANGSGVMKDHHPPYGATSLLLPAWAQRFPLVTLAASNVFVACVTWLLITTQATSGNGKNAFINLFSLQSHQCPTDILSYMNHASHSWGWGVRHNPEPDALNAKERSSPRKFTPVPAPSRKTFYYDGSKLSMPVARALRSRGWHRVDDSDQAALIYTYSNKPEWATDLQPWQRFNYIPGYRKWNNKYDFALYYKIWEQKTGKTAVYVPETYLLTDNEHDPQAFQERLDSGGIHYPWVLKEANVNQGKGIHILAPDSEPLRAAAATALAQAPQKNGAQPALNANDNEEKEGGDDLIIQRYICNEVTWNRRKFDVRMFWIVASLDPLIVLYHDGYVRIGNSEYSETNFEDTTAHLTTHTGLGEEGKATFAELEQALQALWYGKGNSNSANMRKKTRPQLPNGNAPIVHVRNQFKHALAEMVEVFLHEAFNKPDGKDLTSENGYHFYCADFILDQDLDVWFIEPQNGCGLDEDYYFRLEMHASLFNGMVDVLDEVQSKQERGQHVLPLENIGNWEVLYADGRQYTYGGYQRKDLTEKATCRTAEKGNGGAQKKHSSPIPTSSDHHHR